MRLVNVKFLSKTCILEVLVTILIIIAYLVLELIVFFLLHTNYFDSILLNDIYLFDIHLSIIYSSTVNY
jgi:hypothetical protein